MSKLNSFRELKGINKEDNELIQKEKRRYMYSRMFRLIFGGKPTGMGLNLKKPVIASSKGLFYCRENSLDLHIISDSYEYEIKKIFEKIAKRSLVIVDIGANIGRYTILAGLTNPEARVYSIEPNKDNFNILSKNIGLNNLKNIYPINFALGNEVGHIKLYNPSNNQNFGGYSLKIQTDGFNLVPINKFDNLFKENIDLIKMDVEGFEVEVLKGMEQSLSNKLIRNILIEIDDENYNGVEFLVKKYGYTIKKIMYNNYLITLEESE